MFDDFDIHIHSDEREWEFIAWCNDMEEIYADTDSFNEVFCDEREEV